MTAQENNNQKLDKACLEGDLEQVKEIVDGGFGSVQIDYRNSYPLRAACLQGHLDIVKFFLNNKNPKIQSQIKKSFNIRDAISLSIEHGQKKVFLFLKEKYPKEFKLFTSKENAREINRTFDILSMAGRLDAIELLESEIEQDTPVNRTLFLEKSIDYKRNNIFHYCIDNISEEEFKNNIEKAQNVIHSALYHNALMELGVIVEKYNLNLSDFISKISFSIIIDLFPERLSQIVQEYNYRPSQDIMDSIQKILKDQDATDEYRARLEHFMKVIEIKEENETLLSSVGSAKKNIKSTVSKV